VVATLFSGVGLLLYLLGWLLLPAEDDEVSAAESLLGRGRSSMSPALMVLLILALIPASGVVFGGNAFGVVGLATAGAAVFLLHRARAAQGGIPTSAGNPVVGPPAPGMPPPWTPAAGTPAAGTPAAGTPVSGAPVGGTPVRPTTQQPVTGGGVEQPAPPAWDPLGAAPFAWDLPEPTPVPPPAPPPARRPRSKVTPITLGLALLAGGIASAFWPALSTADIVAIVLVVVGLGLVVGSLVRGGRGLIMIAFPLVLLTWILQAVPASSFQVGERRWVPVTAAQVTSHYDLTLGTGELDLGNLRMTDGQTITTVAGVGVGNLYIVLPPNVDAQIVCQAHVGNVDCLDQSNSGIPAEVDVRNSGPDGPGGGTLILQARAGLGNVYVERAS
jgi:hypothetical protein